MVCTIQWDGNNIWQEKAAKIVAQRSLFQFNDWRDLKNQESERESVLSWNLRCRLYSGKLYKRLEKGLYLLRGCFNERSLYASLHFVWKWRKLLTLWRWLLWYFSYKQRSFSSRYVLIPFSKLLKIGVKIRDRCPLRNLTAERTTEKSVNRNKGEKQTNAKHAKQLINQMVKMQTDVRHPRSKMQFKQQRQQRHRQRRLINDVIF